MQSSFIKRRRVFPMFPALVSRLIPALRPVTPRSVFPGPQRSWDLSLWIYLYRLIIESEQPRKEHQDSWFNRFLNFLHGLTTYVERQTMICLVLPVNFHVNRLTLIVLLCLVSFILHALGTPHTDTCSSSVIFTTVSYSTVRIFYNIIHPSS